MAVVIPCFNQGDTLREAVGSVEPLPIPYELVIVNDGSDDPATLAVLSELRAGGYAIHDQPNAGVAAARNAGVAATCAPAILPLDADNRLEPDFIEPALAMLASEPSIGVVYGNRQEFGLREQLVHVAAFDLARLLTHNYIDACAIVSREAWTAVGGYDTTAPIPGWEDWEFWISVAEAGWEFRHLPLPAFDYRVSEGSMIAGTASAEARSKLYDHVIGRHEAFYRAHLTPILTGAQQAAEELASHAREDERLHREVAAQVDEVRRLHAEVATRDDEIRHLHREVAVRDAQIAARQTGDAAP